MNSQVKALVSVLRSILRANSLGEADALMRRTVEAIYGRAADIAVKDGGVFFYGRAADIAVKDGGVFFLLVGDYKQVQKPEWKALHKRYGKFFGPNERAAAHLLYGSEFDSHTAEFRIGVVRNGVFSVK